jgi:hypothetical protein
MTGRRLSRGPPPVVEGQKEEAWQWKKGRVSTAGNQYTILTYNLYYNLHNKHFFIKVKPNYSIYFVVVRRRHLLCCGQACFPLANSDVTLYHLAVFP